MSKELRLENFDVCFCYENYVPMPQDLLYKTRHGESAEDRVTPENLYWVTGVDKDKVNLELKPYTNGKLKNINTNNMIGLVWRVIRKSEYDKLPPAPRSREC